MRRYKIVTCIFLILSIFSFVLAAPVAVREVREACTNEVGGGDNLKNGLGKRIGEEEESSLAPNYASASGTHPFPPGESKPWLLFTSGGTDL
jgi:hypothetical protein